MLATARIHDFRPGVYKRFAVTGPITLTIEVNRNHSFNTIMAGVFLDPLEELTAPWLEASSLRPEYLMQVIHRNNSISENLLVSPDLSKLEQALAILKASNQLAWAREQRTAAAFLISQYRQYHQEVSQELCAHLYYESALFSEWESIHERLFGPSPRKIWNAIRDDGSLGQHHGYDQLYKATVIDKLNAGLSK